MSFNLLILSSDKSTGTNFAKSLQLSRGGKRDDFTIIGTAAHAGRAHLTANDYTVLVPPEIVTDPVRTRDYVEEKLEKTIHLLYETRSGDSMLCVSRNRERLPVFLPPAALVETLENKFQTYVHLQSNGFPVPQTRLLRQPEDVGTAMRAIHAEEYWVRATMGQGGTGALASSDEQEIIEHITAKNGWGRFALSEKLPLDAPLSWESRLSDEFFPGEMINWIALYSHGELIAAQTRKRLYFEHRELTPTGVGYTGAAMSLQRDDIHEVSESMMRSFNLELHGAFGIDFLVGHDGLPKVTEIQPCRFYTTTYFLSVMGVNFPRMYVDTFRGHTVALKKKVNPVPAGMVWLQRFGADDGLHHRDEILALLQTGVLTNDASTIVHRAISSTTQACLDAGNSS
jgi:hypothetical protein